MCCGSLNHLWLWVWTLLTSISCSASLRGPNGSQSCLFVFAIFLLPLCISSTFSVQGPCPHPDLYPSRISLFTSCLQLAHLPFSSCSSVSLSCQPGFGVPHTWSLAYYPSAFSFSSLPPPPLPLPPLPPPPSFHFTPLTGQCPSQLSPVPAHTWVSPGCPVEAEANANPFWELSQCLNVWTVTGAGGEDGPVFWRKVRVAGDGWWGAGLGVR